MWPGSGCARVGPNRKGASLNSSINGWQTGEMVNGSFLGRLSTTHMRLSEFSPPRKLTVAQHEVWTSGGSRRSRWPGPMADAVAKIEQVQVFA